MGFFEYPIDAKSLLRKKHKIKRKLLESKCNFLNKKIAILGGSTTDEIVEQLELFLLNYGIKPEFYQSEYGQYWQDAMFGNDRLDAFHPDLIYIHTNWRNISIFPTVKDSIDSINTMLEEEFSRFLSMWEKIYVKFKCPIIQNNFERPNYRLLGNMDIFDCHGRSNYISRLNQKFYEYAQMHTDFYINDIDYLSADYGLTDWSEPLYWYMYKYALSFNAIPYLAKNIANIIKAIYGKNKKVLVLDLDNTLWGGVIGDTGVAGIEVGPEMPNGQAYNEFQKYCKDLKSIGVVLAVNSKNDESNAIAGLNHPAGRLRPEDFVSIKANWLSKDINILSISDELSLGSDSFVFVDDNPAEREMVQSQIPDVAVPDIGKNVDYIKVLDHCGYFETVNISKEDLEKTELYHAKFRAIRQQSKYASYDEYLQSLNMIAIVKEFEPIYYQRIAQLTNKTNQFNLTTLRCSIDDIEKVRIDPQYITLYGKLQDKFADNGVVTAIIAKQKNNELHIKLWIMSCRVLKRGMEDVMMNTLVEKAQKNNIKKIYGYYYPTEKNRLVKDFYTQYGFKKEQDEFTYCLNVDSYRPKESFFMKIVY